MSNEVRLSSRLSRHYQITVEGKIDPSWTDWLNGMQVHTWQTSDSRQMTTLSGVLADQAALRGLLIRLWDLNLVLYSLDQDNPFQPSR